MRAQILSVGSELILGHLTDTNATYLAQELAALGIDLKLVTQVGDDLPLLAAVIDRASSDADVVVCTGGVGPTADDLTREAIARVVGEEPRVDDELLETVRAFFRARGIEMPERNQKQAWIIPSSEPLLNPIGTAPGWFVRRGTCAIVAMPGVPREMFRMWSEQVVPRLTAMMPGQSVSSTTIKTIGIGESAAEQLLVDLVDRTEPVVATYAKDDGVHVRITARAALELVASAVRGETVREVMRRLGDHVYGLNDTTLPGAIASMLHAARLRVSVYDEGGGGRFASLLSSNPQAARVLVWSGMNPHRSTRSAIELARWAGDQTEENVIAIGIAADANPIGNDVYEGTISVGITGPFMFVESSTIRSGFEDIQRRSALVAADILRRGLLAYDRSLAG